MWSGTIEQGMQHGVAPLNKACSMEWRLEVRHAAWSGVLEEGMQYGVASWRKACSVEWHPGEGVAVWRLEYGIQHGVATLSKCVEACKLSRACGMEWRLGGRHVV